MLRENILLSVLFCSPSSQHTTTCAHTHERRREKELYEFITHSQVSDPVATQVECFRMKRKARVDRHTNKEWWGVAVDERPRDSVKHREPSHRLVQFALNNQPKRLFEHWNRSDPEFACVASVAVLVERAPQKIIRNIVPCGFLWIASRVFSDSTMYVYT